MKQKNISITALCICLLWVFILFRGVPQLIYDPDGVVDLITLILLDFLLIVVGGFSAIFAFKRRSSWWIPVSVLAIPAMHVLGSITESPINLICFIAPAAVFSVIVLIKWNASMADE